MCIRDRLNAKARDLRARMQEIERGVFILRGRKQDFLDADYWREMETLLVDLAVTTGKFNEVVGGTNHETETEATNGQSHD